MPPLAAERWIASPVWTLPVKAMRFRSGWRTSASPASTPPVTMLTTPGGKASAKSSPRASVESGVCGAGFITIVLPTISAGNGRLTANIIGWLKARIRPTTP